MSMQYIRDYYEVPAFRGDRVEYTPCEGSKDAEGRMGIICGAQGQYLKVRLDGDRHAGIYHPVWQLRFIDGDRRLAGRKS